ncbi:MAG: DUF4062 domain-containing protein [Verrucomicrobiaceae bacterium]|nr:DUF4062 domain-containing protein [Verrucomicrobiaceae bacterium]
MTPPKVFISATSSDLRHVRQIVRDALLSIECFPIEQTTFPPDWRTVQDMLRSRIEGCQALIHIAGMCYGAEPDPATLPAGTPRRSYTQMEYDIGCELQQQRGDAGFRVYTFVCPEDFPYLQAAVEGADKKAFQLAHRAGLLQSPRLYESPGDEDQIRARIHVLREPIIALQQHHVAERNQVRSWSRIIFTVLALALVLSGGIAAMQMLMRKDLGDIKAGQTIDSARIKTHLREVSERTLAEDLVIADQEKKSDDRQRARNKAQANHQTRLARIDELAKSIASLEGRPGTTEELREMTRILSEEGVDAALSYIEGRRATVLARAAAIKSSKADEIRAQLQLLLQEARLLASKGQTAAARSGFEQLRELDPEWSEAMWDFAWFLFDQSIQSARHGVFSAALKDAEDCLLLAEKISSEASDMPGVPRLLSSSLGLLAEHLATRAGPGDLKLAFEHYTRSLKLQEEVLKADASSSVAARDVSVTLISFADFLAARGQPGDADMALKHLNRSLELREGLLKKEGSPEARRDVSVCLNNVGGFLARRGSPSDLDLALKHCTRSLELADALLLDTPDDPTARRDVTVSLNNLGDILSARDQAGDSDKALEYYSRGFDIAKSLLMANPKSREAARDVSVVLNKRGEFLGRRGRPGDVDEALHHFMFSVSTAERLSAANPDSAEASRDVAVSLNKLGGFQMAHTSAQDAFESYDRSRQIEEKILQDNPDSAQAARDVTVSIGNLAVLLSQSGKPDDADTALNYFTRSLDMREKLLHDNPGSVQAAQDVHVALWFLGSFFDRRGMPGDADKAFGYFMRSLEMRENLLRADPLSVQLNEDVHESLLNLAGFLVLRAQPGDTETAFRFFTRSLEMRDKLLRANPGSDHAAQAVHSCLWQFGDFLCQRAQPGDSDTAFKFYSRSLEMREKNLQASPHRWPAVREVQASLTKLGGFLAGRDEPGDVEAALKLFERELELAAKLCETYPKSYECASDLAFSHERLGNIARKHGRLDAAGEHFLQAFGIAAKMQLAYPNDASIVQSEVILASHLAEIAGQSEKDDATTWWQRAHDILEGFLAKGNSISGDDDKKWLEELRSKTKRP